MAQACVRLTITVKTTMRILKNNAIEKAKKWKYTS